MYLKAVCEQSIWGEQLPIFVQRSRNMAEITKEITEVKDITVFKVTGEITFEEAADAIHKFYGSDTPQNVIWDFSAADVSSLGSGEIAKILDAAKTYAHLREDCKTAFVQSHDLGYGLSRMFEMMAEGAEYSVPVAVFRDFDKAMRWLDE